MQPEDLRVIAEKLEIINLQLARREKSRKRLLRGLLIALCVLVVMVFVGLIVLDSPYLAWDYSDPERAVVGVVLHAFEWLFVRLAPIALIGAIAGLIWMRG